MKYCYFPGCSLEASAVAYAQSIQAITNELGIELVELEDWNCCGTSPYSSVDELLACCVSARNLALAEKSGLDLVTACSSCYRTLGKTNELLKQYPELKKEVDEALAAGGLEYHGRVKVRHLADVLLRDVGPEAIAAKVKRKLDGLGGRFTTAARSFAPRASSTTPSSPNRWTGWWRASALRLSPSR